jgi:hypothetical protein
MTGMKSVNFIATRELPCTVQKLLGIAIAFAIVVKLRFG